MLECALGYYINPIFSVFLGFVFLRESLTRTQKVAVVLAIIGVGIIATGTGNLPFISIALATTFGFYGLIKKQLPLDPTLAFTLECLMMLPLGLLALPFLDWNFYSGNLDPRNISLVFSAGIVTAVPLLLFNKGNKLVPLSLIGMIQFSAPTVKFIIGLLVFGESLSLYSVMGFAFIWAGVISFSLHGMASLESLSKRKMAPIPKI